MEPFLEELYKMMSEARKGWVHVWVNGEKLKLSFLRASFVLQAPDGKTQYNVAPPGGLVFSEDGLFEFKV